MPPRPRPTPPPEPPSTEALLRERYRIALEQADAARVNYDNARAILRVADRHRDEARTALELHKNPARGL